MVQYQNLPAAKIADNHEGLRKESKVRIAAWIYTSIQFASMQREILNVGIQRWSCWGMEYNNSKRNSLWRYGLLRFLDHVPAMETLKRALVTQDDEPPAKKASILHGRFFFSSGEHSWCQAKSVEKPTVNPLTERPFSDRLLTGSIRSKFGSGKMWRNRQT